MTKIILILPHENYYQTSSTIPPFKQRSNKNGQLVGVWDGHWADLYARDMEKVDTGEFEYQIWQPDSRADTVLECSISDRVIHRLYPAKITGPPIDHLDVLSPVMILDISALEHSFVILFGLLTPFNKRILNAINDEHNTLMCLNLDLHLPWKQKIKLLRPHRIFTSMVSYFHVRGVAKQYDLVSYATESQRESLISLNKNLIMIVTGIDFEDWPSKLDVSGASVLSSICDRKFMILMSGRIVPVKGFGEVIECLADLQTTKDYVLYIAGSGSMDYERILHRKVQQLCLEDRIVFTGYLSNEDLMILYKRCNLFISASSQEGGPVSTVKAMAMEKPILTTDTGLAAEVLTKANCGKIMPARFQKHTWVKAIRESIEHTESIPVMPRSEARKIYDNEMIATNILNALKSRKKW